MNRKREVFGLSFGLGKQAGPPEDQSRQRVNGSDVSMPVAA